MATAAWLVAGTALSRANEIAGQLPWYPNAGNPPAPVRPGPWQFFTLDEATAVQALADRIIPPDPQTPGGKDAGCAVFVDRQLAGPYGRAEGHYNRPPFMHGAKNQGRRRRVVQPKLIAMGWRHSTGTAARSTASPSRV